MLLQTLLVTYLAVLKVTSSLPLAEKSDPVELSHQCIHFHYDGKEEEYKNKSQVVLLHGLGGSKSSWGGLPEIIALRTRRRVCAVDFRNHGDSPWNNNTEISDLAADVGHFLDKQGIKKVNLIGHSLGGKTAVHFTLKNPDRVDSLITEDIGPNGVPQEAQMFVQSMTLVLKAAINSVPSGADEDEAKGSIVKFINDKLKEMGSSDLVTDEDAKMVEIRSVNGKWQYKWNIDLFTEIVKNPDFFPRETGVYNGKVLFIYGTASPFKVGDEKAVILGLFPNAQLQSVNGAGHMIHGKFPEFDDAVIKFLQ